MKVLLAAAEIAPWVREGATAEDVASLAAALSAAGAEVRVAVPDYPVFAGVAGRVEMKRAPERTNAAVASSRRDLWVEAEADGVRLVLVRKPEFFDRGGVYGSADAPYEDNFERFSFFARAVLAAARGWGADVVHAFDWPGALVAAAAGSADAPVTLGLRDFVFQGDFPPERFTPGGWAWEDSGKFEFYGRGNALKAGLLSARAVVLPGVRMADAVQEPGAGCGLEGVAASAGDRLHGILTGVDYGECLDAGTEEGRRRKASARREWLAAMKMEPLPDDGMFMVVPLDFVAGRGLDTLLPVLDRMMEFPLRVAVLGQPPGRFAPELQLAALRHRGRFALLGGDAESLHAACTAADAMLWPDEIEPSALRRIAAALRPGTVPLALTCPGLAEIVTDHDPSDRPGTGLVYYRRHPEAVWDTVVRAFALRQAGAWPGVSGRTAAQDFSWSSGAVRCLALFRSVASVRRDAA